MHVRFNGQFISLMEGHTDNWTPSERVLVWLNKTPWPPSCQHSSWPMRLFQRQPSGQCCGGGGGDEITRNAEMNTKLLLNISVAVHKNSDAAWLEWSKNVEAWALNYTPSVPKVMLHSIFLKSRSGVSFGSFFVDLGMFVQHGNASVMEVNITCKKFPPIFEKFRICCKPPIFQMTHIHII